MRGRSQSFTTSHQTPQVTLPDGTNPKTNVWEPQVPQQFLSVIQQGLIPGGGGGGLTSNDGVQGYPQVCVQRMQQTPSQNDLNTAMENTAMGIIPVTAERSNNPLDKRRQVHQVHMGNDVFNLESVSLSPQGVQQAQQRVNTSMLVTAQVPANTGLVNGVSEQNRQSVLPNQMTGVSVPNELVGPLKQQMVRQGIQGPQVHGVTRQNFDVFAAGTNVSSTLNAPDYRPVIQAQTNAAPRDLHVVRAEPPTYQSRPRSKSLG